MCRHFLCRTHYVEKKQRAIERKVKGTEDSELCLVRSALSPIHIPRNNCFSPLLKVWKPKWFMQPYKEQSVAPPSQLFQNPVIVFTLIFFFLNCRPIVLLPWNLTFPILTVFTIAPLSSHQAHTCPWLSKAIYLVSEACAMGLFGAQKPDTVLSIAIATAASQYSSKGPEQVELKSWWLGNDVFLSYWFRAQTDRPDLGFLRPGTFASLKLSTRDMAFVFQPLEVPALGWRSFLFHLAQAKVTMTSFGRPILLQAMILAYPSNPHP